jgi:hypothetical protein
MEWQQGSRWETAQTFHVVPPSEVDDDPTQPGVGRPFLRQARGGIPVSALLAGAKRLSTFDRAFVRLQRARSRAASSSYGDRDPAALLHLTRRRSNRVFVGMTTFSW